MNNSYSRNNRNSVKMPWNNNKTSWNVTPKTAEDKAVRMQSCASKIFNMLKEMCENGTLVKSVCHETFRIAKLPQDKLSVFNRLLLIAQGATDARNYNEWKKAGRYVKSGEKALFVFKPVPIIDEEINEDGEKEKVVKGMRFTLTPQFDVSQTDGKPLEENESVEQYYNGENTAPLLEIAKLLNITVSARNLGEAWGGYSAKGNAIYLKAKTETVFAHELIHAADEVNYPNHVKNYHKDIECRKTCETVAEFGSAVLLAYLGYENKVDLSGVLDYITSWNDKEPEAAMKAVSRLMKRVSENVTYLTNKLEGKEVEQETEQVA